MSDFLNIIILLGTLQGIITSILLFSAKSNKQANKILGWIILLISLTCLNIYFLETLEDNYSLVLNLLESVIPLVIIMPIGPLIYFYIQAILNPKFKLNKANRPHFFGILLDIIPNLTAIVYIAGYFLGFIDSKSSDTWGNFIETYNMYVDIPRWLSLMIYLLLSFKTISAYNNNKENDAFLTWAKSFIMGFSTFSIIWFLHLLLYIIPSFSNILLSTVGWYPVYIPLIILVYWLGINGYIISFKTYKKESRSKEITENTIKNTISTLEYLMKEELLYLNPYLKLSDIIKQTEIPQKTISAVLNQHLHKSFNEYINSYRVEHFKSRLLEDNVEKFTITGIAFECGFNSQATFQRAFKAHTNQSPSEFRKEHLKSQ